MEVTARMSDDAEPHLILPGNIDEVRELLDRFILTVAIDNADLLDPYDVGELAEMAARATNGYMMKALWERAFEAKRTDFTAGLFVQRAKRATKRDRAKERADDRKWQRARLRQVWATRDDDTARTIYDILDIAAEAGIQMTEEQKQAVVLTMLGPPPR
jgi:hypothetical protein